MREHHVQQQQGAKRRTPQPQRGERGTAAAMRERHAPHAAAKRERHSSSSVVIAENPQRRRIIETGSMDVRTLQSRSMRDEDGEREDAGTRSDTVHSNTQKEAGKEEVELLTF